MAPPSDEEGISEEEELRIRQKVVEGLELAIEDVIPDEKHREITKTEREKLIYFAIRKFDLPITYSWYLAGAKTAYTPAPSTETTSPEESSLPSPEEFVQPKVNDTDPEVQQYKEFFRSESFFDDYDLESVYFTGNTDFLYDFYESCAKDKYSDLYIESTRLREKLRNLDEEIDRGSSSASLADWGGGTDDGILSRNQEEKIRRQVSTVHMELAQLEGFDETRQPVTEGTNVIESVLTKLTHLSSLNKDQTDLVLDLGDFFYHNVWKYPALKISVETATGPNAEVRASQHREWFNGFDDTLESRIEELSEDHQQAGLAPTIEEFGANEDPQEMVAFHSMTRDVIDPTK